MPKGVPGYTRFLPSFVGSKWQWIGRLSDEFKNRPVVEMFAGSAVLAANLASEAMLVELDPQLAKILANLDQQIIIDPFTVEDYHEVKKKEDWWRYAYCLQAMSYSGVFRWSGNGYNVPPKRHKHKDSDEYKQPEPISVSAAYAASLARWEELRPIVHNTSYTNISDDMILDLMGEDVVVIMDPPYQGSQASYNQAPFDYDEYWDRVASMAGKFDIILFDRVKNLEAHGYVVSDTRKMRVNGARDGDIEGISIIRREKKENSMILPPLEEQKITLSTDSSPSHTVPEPRPILMWDLARPIVPKLASDIDLDCHVEVTLSTEHFTMTLPPGSKVRITIPKEQ